jgi:hypothetical protein
MANNGYLQPAPPEKGPRGRTKAPCPRDRDGIGATPLTPPVEAADEVDDTEYSVVDDPEPRAQITLTVLEHGLSPDELPLYERLEALVDTLLPGDILYLTIPRSMAGDSITSWLLAHFAASAR